MSTNVSIIIVTRNRASDLRATLESLSGICVPDDLATELILVDNGSSDNTGAVIQEFAPPQMTLRIVREDRPGKSHGLNAGLAAAQGDVLLFTDDDVRVPSDWIQGMCAPILTGAGQGVAGGIRIAPHLERPWMIHKHREWLASTESLDPANPQEMIGANMAISREVFARIPGFDPELGPGALGFVEETLLSRQMKVAGFKLAGAFDTTLVHHFDASRLTRPSLILMARRCGMVAAYLNYHWEHNEPTHPAAEILRGILRLTKWRFKSLAWQYRDGMPAWEIQALIDYHTVRHFLTERRRPRNYEKHGLVRRHRTG